VMNCANCLGSTPRHQTTGSFPSMLRQSMKRAAVRSGSHACCARFEWRPRSGHVRINGATET
jgi:hypothetical protein